MSTINAITEAKKRTRTCRACNGLLPKSMNKSQGQSVQHVGLYLHTPVFAHGQLYVALSHATSPHNINILLPEDTEESLTTNIVYKEVVID